MQTCKLCAKKFKFITNTHLAKAHRTSIKKYIQKFGPKGVGFKTSFTKLSKDDPRHIAWREKLLHRPPVWNKGQTKETNKTLSKMAESFRRRKLNNFLLWQNEQRKNGKFGAPTIPLNQNADLAFLIGLVLGDGHIHAFPRTESLRITLGTDKPLLWKFAYKIVKDILQKKPHVRKRKESACVDIQIYQKGLSARLGIPAGNRGQTVSVLPEWIGTNREYLIAYIRGLYEAEGYFGIHKPTSTYKLIFNNKNDSLLDIVFDSIQKLGFHPHRSKFKVQLSRKDEVLACKKLLGFRIYA